MDHLFGRKVCIESRTLSYLSMNSLFFLGGFVINIIMIMILTI